MKTKERETSRQFEKDRKIGLIHSVTFACVLVYIIGHIKICAYINEMLIFDTYIIPCQIYVCVCAQVHILTSKKLNTMKKERVFSKESHFTIF